MIKPEANLDLGCFYGKTLQEYRLRELSLSEAVHPPNSVLPEHSHEVTHFCFVLRGGYREIWGSKAINCEPSTLIFHPKRISHSNLFYKTGGRCFTIAVASNLMERIGKKSSLTDGISYFNKGLVVNYAKKLYREFCVMDDFSSLTIEGLVLEVLAEMSRQKVIPEDDIHPHWLNMLLEILHSRFSESLTLVEIAGLVGRHPSHISREFRKRYRCTLGEYIRTLRVEFACSELSKKKKSLSQIALTAGFSHQSHFCSSFKQIMGVTPKEYQEILRIR